MVVVDDIWQLIFKIKEIIKQSKLKDTNYALYYASQFAFQSSKKLWQKKLKLEKKLGIKRIKSHTSLSLEAQLIPGKLIRPSLKELTILNIEYPLGFTAFHLLGEVLENTENIIKTESQNCAARIVFELGKELIDTNEWAWLLCASMFVEFSYTNEENFKLMKHFYPGLTEENMATSTPGVNARKISKYLIVQHH